MLRYALIGIVLAAPAAFLPALAAGQDTFKDCRDCPTMVVVPAGSFLIGADDTEPDVQIYDHPTRAVTIKRSFALAQTEVTRGQYKAFMRESAHPAPGPCNVWDGEWLDDGAYDWLNPGYQQGDDHPVVCVGWYDALAYVHWLNTKNKHTYHLPSESGWEYAARAGTQTARYWGDAADEACAYANVADETFGAKYPEREIHTCDDGAVSTALVKSYKPNAYGLYDMIGNVWEWVFDCWSFDHHEWTGDERPITDTDYCDKRVIKGGGFSSEKRYTRSATRSRDPIPDARLYLIGFRVAAAVEDE